MRKYFTAFLTVALMIIFVLPIEARKDKAATIRFEEQAYNFGTIKEDGGSVSHDFNFVNDGDGNLVILDATAQCGCTRPEYPKNPVAPGKTGKIKITYNPIGRPGAFEKVVTLKTNAKTKKVRLKISGTVVPKKK